MILVAGSANLDFVVRAAHIPAPGETVLGRDFKTYPGGKGANQAVACARAGGAPIHMLLALGNDSFATPLESSLTRAGVQMHVVRSQNQPTGTAFICVSDEAENAITVAPGANQSLSESDLPPLDGFSHLLLQLETPLDTVTAYAQVAQAQGVTVVLNAAPAQSLPRPLLDAVDALIVNEGELAAVAQASGNIAHMLSTLALPCVVVTLGARGCCALRNGAFSVQPGFAVEPIDTTGAGDTFCGVFVASLSQGLSLPEALKRACAASALACTRPGAQSSIPTLAEVSDFLARQGNATPAATAELNAYCGIPN